jgi:hypothetical protein
LSFAPTSRSSRRSAAVRARSFLATEGR